MLVDLLGQQAQVIQAALIGPDRDGPAACVCDLAGDLPRGALGVQIAEHHRGGVAGQPFDDGPANPPRPACHQGPFTV